MRIKLHSIFVDNQEKALAFYTEVLGFVKKQDIPMGEARWLTVVSPEDTEGTEVVLEPSDNPATKTFKQTIFEQGVPFTAFEVTNLTEEVERLKTLSVHFTQEPLVMGSVIQAVFDDTCGNLIQLYQIVQS